jgi:hypothetical protein
VKEGRLSDPVAEQVRFATDAIRAAREQSKGFDYRALTVLAEQMKAAAIGASLKERRAFLKEVGERLQQEAGSSREVTAKGHATKLHLFDDPDGETIHTFGTLLVMMAKRA